MTEAETILFESADTAALPAPVRAIRDKILAACATDDIEALRIPIDWNEVRPLFADFVEKVAVAVETKC